MEVTGALLVIPFSPHYKRIPYFPTSPTSSPSTLLPTLLLLNMAFRSFASSLLPAVSTSGLWAGLLDSNLFLILRRYDPVAPLPSLSPLALQCYPSPVVADGIVPKLPTNPIAPLLTWPSDSAISQFLLWSYLRILLRSPPTLTSSTMVVSSDLIPHFDHFPIFPEYRPTIA